MCNAYILITLNIGGQRQAQSYIKRNLPRFDVLALTETWLMAGDDPAGFKLPGFVAHHCCRARDAESPLRGRPHGGVSVFVRADLAEHMLVSSDASHGIVWVKLTQLRMAFACCYFSPQEGGLYKRGALAPDPLEPLHAGLILLASRGFFSCVLGDLNSRIGTLSDVPVPESMHAESALGCPTANDYDGVPPRSTRDVATPNGFGAALLNLLVATSMVVVNGRTRGDPHGGVTCRPSGVVERA